MWELSRFRFRDFIRQNFKKRERKKNWPAGLARPEAGPRPGASGGLPALSLLRDRPRPEQRPAASVALPASCASRPAQAGVEAGPSASFGCCFLCVRSLGTFPGRPGRLPASPGPGTLQCVFPLFFLSNGSFLEPPIKGASPFALVALVGFWGEGFDHLV